MQVRYLIFILLFALKSFAQGGTFGKNPIINDENFDINNPIDKEG